MLFGSAEFDRDEWGQDEHQPAAAHDDHHVEDIINSEYDLNLDASPLSSASGHGGNIVSIDRMTRRMIFSKEVDEDVESEENLFHHTTRCNRIFDNIMIAQNDRGEAMLSCARDDLLDEQTLLGGILQGASDADVDDLELQTVTQDSSPKDDDFIIRKTALATGRFFISRFYYVSPKTTVFSFVLALSLLALILHVGYGDWLRLNNRDINDRMVPETTNSSPVETRDAPMLSQENSIQELKLGSGEIVQIIPAQSDTMKTFTLKDGAPGSATGLYNWDRMTEKGKHLVSIEDPIRPRCPRDKELPCLWVEEAGRIRLRPLLYDTNYNMDSSIRPTTPTSSIVGDGRPFQESSPLGVIAQGSMMKKPELQDGPAEGSQTILSGASSGKNGGEPSSSNIYFSNQQTKPRRLVIEWVILGDHGSTGVQHDSIFQTNGVTDVDKPTARAKSDAHDPSSFLETSETRKDSPRREKTSAISSSTFRSGESASNKDDIFQHRTQKQDFLARQNSSVKRIPHNSRLRGDGRFSFLQEQYSAQRKHDLSSKIKSREDTQQRHRRKRSPHTNLRESFTQKQTVVPTAPHPASSKFHKIHSEGTRNSVNQQNKARARGTKSLAKRRDKKDFDPLPYVGRMLSAGPYPTVEEVWSFYDEWSEARRDGAIYHAQTLQILEKDGFAHKDYRSVSSKSRLNAGQDGVIYLGKGDLAGNSLVKSKAGWSLHRPTLATPRGQNKAYGRGGEQPRSSFLETKVEVAHSRESSRKKTGRYGRTRNKETQHVEMQEYQQESRAKVSHTTQKWHTTVDHEHSSKLSISSKMKTKTGKKNENEVREERPTLAPPLDEVRSVYATGAYVADKAKIDPQESGRGPDKQDQQHPVIEENVRDDQGNPVGAPDQEQKIIDKPRMMASVCIGDVHMSLDSDPTFRQALGHADMNELDNSSYKDVQDELAFVASGVGYQACSSFGNLNTFTCTRDIADSTRIRTYLELNMELSGIFFSAFTFNNPDSHPRIDKLERKSISQKAGSVGLHVYESSDAGEGWGGGEAGMPKQGPNGEDYTSTYNRGMIYVIWPDADDPTLLDSAERAGANIPILIRKYNQQALHRHDLALIEVLRAQIGPSLANNVSAIARFKKGILKSIAGSGINRVEFRTSEHASRGELQKALADVMTGHA